MGSRFFNTTCPVIIIIIIIIITKEKIKVTLSHQRRCRGTEQNQTRRVVALIIVRMSAAVD